MIIFTLSIKRWKILSFFSYIITMPLLTNNLSKINTHVSRLSCMIIKFQQRKHELYNIHFFRF